MALTPNVAWSQDALHSAVAADRSYKLRSAPLQYPQEYHVIGALSYRLGVSYSLEWLDNVFNTSTNKQSDFLHTPQFDIDARWQVTKESMLHFGTGVSYRKYQDTKSQDRLGVTPSSELAWDIRVQDWVFTVYDRFSYTQDVISQASLAGVASFPRLENTAGLRTSWRPNRFGLQMGYGHVNNFTSQVQDQANARIDRGDHTSEQFFSRAGYSIAPQTEVGLEVSGGLTDYSEVAQSDNQSISVGPFLDWQLTQKLSLDLRGGFVRYHFDPSTLRANSDNKNSYYAGASVRYQLTQHITESLEVEKQIQQGLNQGSQFIEETSIRNAINWAFHRHASFGTDVFYTRGKEPQLALEERYNQLGIGTTFRYELTKNLAPSLRYTYARRNSNQSSRDYAVNSIVFSISYRF